MTLPSAEELSRLLAVAGLPVPPPSALSALLLHASEMLRWNRAIRLTSVTDPFEVAVKHVADSLTLLRFSPFEGEILDFGSGAGYPGIPLAICLPRCRITLLEAAGKKCSFLSHVRSRLELDNLEVVHGRLEKRTFPVPREKFDHVVTRATLSAAEAAPLLSPLLRRAGRLLLMEGPAGGEGSPPGAFLVPGRVLSFSLPLRMGERTVREFVRLPPDGRRGEGAGGAAFSGEELSRLRERYGALPERAMTEGAAWADRLGSFEKFLREGPRVATELRRGAPGDPERGEGASLRDACPPLWDLLLDTFPLDVPL